jgi:hypothetical protein
VEFDCHSLWLWWSIASWLTLISLWTNSFLSCSCCFTESDIIVTFKVLLWSFLSNLIDIWLDKHGFLVCGFWGIAVGLQHVYIPVLFYAGVDYIDAPTPYLMGLHSAVDTTDLTMDGVCFFAVLFWSQLTFPLVFCNLSWEHWKQCCWLLTRASMKFKYVLKVCKEKLCMLWSQCIIFLRF